MSRARPTTLAIAATLSTLSLAACKAHQEADARTTDRLVLVTPVEASPGITHTYTGLVAARVQSDLGFRVPGKVIERLVDTGQVVKAGQPLMRIDPTDYLHAVTAQAGDVAAAKAHWIQASADERRYRGLVASGAVSQILYDQAKATADSARALLSAAQAQEQVARNQNDYAVLLADGDGTVVETLAEPGQVVAAGQTVVRLAHAGPREAVVDLPETIRPAIGDLAQVSLYGDTVHASAHLRQLSDSAEPQTRTYEARYVMEGDGASAPLGATVTLTLNASRQATTVQVPLGAIDDEGKGAGVWVLDRGTSRVTFTPVKVSDLGGETTDVTGDLHLGDDVVSTGGHFLHEGDHVRIADEKAAMQ
jgi:RND family efflux transporter MFP subunit